MQWSELEIQKNRMIETQTKQNDRMIKEWRKNKYPSFIIIVFASQHHSTKTNVWDLNVFINVYNDEQKKILPDFLWALAGLYCRQNF